MHSKINKKHETIMCLCIISEVHYSYDQGEIMMFDGCNSKNMPGQFTTAHISGCGYLYKHCRFEMKDLNLSTKQFDAATKPLNVCI